MNKIIGERRKFHNMIKIGVGGIFSFFGLAMYHNNEKFYKSIVMPAFHLLEPERAHQLGIILAKYNFVPNVEFDNQKFFESSVVGIKFKNPVGVAAGFDKNGECIEGLFKMGFGFVEVGSVTPKPQPGNKKPRIFRLSNVNAIINRCGFNSDGHDAVFERISKIPPRGQRKGVIGINLGKNLESKDPIEDYTLGIKKFATVSDYFVINISSPNTPGLRTLQREGELRKLTREVIKTRNSLPGDYKPPIFLKISPDLSWNEKCDIAKVISEPKHRIDGLIISNTTVSRPPVECEYINEKGGLSGLPLKDLSTHTLRDMALLTKGSIPIIGVGGIFNGNDAKDKIYNGACLVQIYSCVVFEGPPAVKRIVHELETVLREDGHESISTAVGAKVKNSF